MNNNANGGNLIWNTVSEGHGQANGDPTGWSAASAFTLLDADIAWKNDSGFPDASQWTVQTTAASVDPLLTSTDDNADNLLIRLE